MPNSTTGYPPDLSADGLNLVAVFNIADLPTDLLDVLKRQCAQLCSYTQLILFAHGGTAFWKALQTYGMKGDNPVDTFTMACISDCFARKLADHRYEMLYPGHRGLNLQKLGELAGWHHGSPFMVGVNAGWGSWFAYRAVVLADTQFSVTPVMQGGSPCLRCESKPCITACPADAMRDGEFSLQACMGYRKSEGSLCRSQCLARQACPVASQHRYSDEQINYHYSVSMRVIEDYGR